MNMIPLARISSEDDRPAGLKFDRTGYSYGRDNSSMQKSFLDKDTFHKPSLTQHKNAFQIDNAIPRSSLDSDQYRPSNMSTSRDYYSGRGTPPSNGHRTSNQPSLPARSPFRVRDSQTSINGKTNYEKYREQLKSPPTYGRNESATERMDSDHRGSLSDEIAQLWKYRPDSATEAPSTPKDTQDTTETNDMDVLLMQLLVSQAVFESREFKILPFEELDTLRAQYKELREQVENVMNRWSVEIQIHQTSRSLAQLEGEKRLSLEQEAITATQKAGTLSMELIRLMEKANKAHHSLLEHTAAALRAGVERLEKTQQGSKANQHSTSVAKLEGQLAEAKAKIASQASELRSMTHQGDSSRDRTIAELRTELEQMTRQLDVMLQRHRSNRESQATDLSGSFADSGYGQSHNGEGLSLLNLLDNELASARSTMTALQRQIDANAEKRRLESITERKYEIQLSALKEKKEAAEARCEELTRELEKRGAASAIDSDLAHLGATADKHGQVSQLKDRVQELERQLQQAADKEAAADEEMERLRTTLRDYEVRCRKAEAQVTAVTRREQAMESELRDYKDQSAALQLEKQRWERILKRESVMQVMEGGGDAMRSKYEQQLEEQRQEYEAQLQEQHALLAKTQRAQEAAEVEREKMASVCKDLEDLVRDKTRTVDARDVSITRLEGELAEAKRQLTKGVGIAGDPRAAAQLKEAQEAFSKREAAWMERSASMEANFEGILKEFDRLTVTAMEFETDRRNYEQRIDQLTRQVQQLDNELTDTKISGLGHGSSEGPTTTSLRREFRKLVNDMKADHQRVLDQETVERKKLESRLNDLRHERDVAQYGRANKGVQTMLIFEP